MDTAMTEAISETDHEQIFTALSHIGTLPDSNIDLAETALYLAALNHPLISLDRYRQHLRKIADDVVARFSALKQQGAPDDATTRITALKDILAVQNEFRGADPMRYDDLQNADLIRVIDRRQGLPVALAILYIDAGRRAGFAVDGLNIPGHFVLRMTGDAGERILFDPFEQCAILQAPDLRAIVKRYLGEQAELSASYYEPCDNRTILLRLQNNIKLRLIEAEDYAGALFTVQAMRRFAPDEYRLLLDEGVLCARTGHYHAALSALEDYINRAPDIRDRNEAGALVAHIRNILQ